MAACLWMRIYGKPQTAACDLKTQRSPDKSMTEPIFQVIELLHDEIYDRATNLLQTHNPLRGLPPALNNA
jgi:hypothetical protein